LRACYFPSYRPETRDAERHGEDWNEWTEGSYLDPDTLNGRERWRRDMRSMSLEYVALDLTSHAGRAARLALRIENGVSSTQNTQRNAEGRGSFRLFFCTFCAFLRQAVSLR